MVRRYTSNFQKSQIFLDVTELSEYFKFSGYSNSTTLDVKFSEACQILTDVVGAHPQAVQKSCESCKPAENLLQLRHSAYAAAYGTKKAANAAAFKQISIENLTFKIKFY